MSRWNGQIKYLTKDCLGCDFYRKIKNQDLCGWGQAFKYLVQREKLRKCEVKNREFKGRGLQHSAWVEHSVVYLDSIINKTEYPPKNKINWNDFIPTSVEEPKEIN